MVTQRLVIYGETWSALLPQGTTATRNPLRGEAWRRFIQTSFLDERSAREDGCACRSNFGPMDVRLKEQTARIYVVW